MFVLGFSISVQTSKKNIWNNKYMEGPNKHWGIEKKKITSGGGGDVYWHSRVNILYIFQ